jgi:hypothetical protein
MLDSGFLMLETSFLKRVRIFQKEDFGFCSACGFDWFFTLACQL